MDVQAVAEAAGANHIKHLVFAHIGRPTIRALERGATVAFGQFAHDGQRFRMTRAG